MCIVIVWIGVRCWVLSRGVYLGIGMGCVVEDRDTSVWLGV